MPTQKAKKPFARLNTTNARAATRMAEVMFRRMSILRISGTTMNMEISVNRFRTIRTTETCGLVSPPSEIR